MRPIRNADVHEEESIVYQERRERLMERMGQGSIGLWMSPPTRMRNADSDYLFRQHSDILYLTGCPSPETAVVLRPSAETERFVLFVQPRDVDKEIWTGRRLGPDRAKAKYGADAAYPIADLPKKMASYLVDEERFFYRMGQDADQDRQVTRWLEQVRRQRRQGKRTPGRIMDPDELLHELRLFKDQAELDLMRRAAQLTSEAHAHAMKVVRPNMSEYQLEAAIAYHLRKHGCKGMSYNPIVGGGENATILHYNENDDTLKDGDLVLIDAGAEYKHYAADITRTFPVNGTFSDAQRKVYQIVLEAEEAAIAVAKPGNRFDDIHQAAVRRITQGLSELGVLTGELDALIEDEAYKPYYMHKTGHWLGLDVHDPGNYFEDDGSSRILKPGMVLTIEPGLYFNIHYHDRPEVRPYHGIGIRIEDDILITEDGHENLTASCPKQIDEIEAIACTAEML